MNTQHECHAGARKDTYSASAVEPNLAPEAAPTVSDQTSTSGRARAAILRDSSNWKTHSLSHDPYVFRGCFEIFRIEGCLDSSLSAISFIGPKRQHNHTGQFHHNFRPRGTFSVQISCSLGFLCLRFYDQGLGCPRICRAPHAKLCNPKVISDPEMFFPVGKLVPGTSPAAREGGRGSQGRAGS